MICSIVACGDSAKDWHKIPVDLSIGCNDMKKWGKDPDQLVLINFERKFTPERLKLIKSTNAKVWTHTSTWKKHFPSAEVIRLTPFVFGVHKGLIYCSKTSTLVAISLAVKQNANNIILWGVDFRGHKTYSEGTKIGDHEISVYLKFFTQLRKLGINIFRGSDGSAFDKYLPLYENKYKDQGAIV